MVRCQIILEVIERERLVDNAAAAGLHLQERLRELCGEFPGLISNARGRGLFCAFDCAGIEKRNSILSRAREHGVLLLPSGESAIRLRPALTMTGAEIDEAWRRLREVLKKEV
jgi:L-lysine 6-transaminase